MSVIRTKSAGRHLHLLQNSFFVGPLLAFLKEHFPEEYAASKFYAMGCTDRISTDAPIEVVKTFGQFSRLYFQLRPDDKVFFHSFPAAHKRLLLLASRPGLLRRMTWIVWGGDLYNEYEYLKSTPTLSHRSRLFFLRFVTSRFGAVATLVPGDFEYARRVLTLRGAYKPVSYVPLAPLPAWVNPAGHPAGQPWRILVGNSASKTNLFEDAFKRLARYREEPIEIYAPLSYGDKAYGREVASLGHAMFGDKFKPLLDWMAPESYAALLNSIDVAVFNYERQQGLGNIYHLIAAGKRVYLRSDGPMWPFFKSDLRADIGDACAIGQISFQNLCAPADGAANHARIAEHLSTDNLRRMWGAIIRG